MVGVLVIAHDCTCRFCLYYRGKPLPYRAVPIPKHLLPCSEEAYLPTIRHRMESLLGDRALRRHRRRPTTAKAKMLGLCGSGDPLVVTHQHRIRRRVLDPEDAIHAPSRRRFRRLADLSAVSESRVEWLSSGEQNSLTLNSVVGPPVFMIE